MISTGKRSASEKASAVFPDAVGPMRKIASGRWSDIMQGRIHAPVDVPETGTRAEKTSSMTKALADAFATGIAEHPEDWHMLQRLWLADLAPHHQEPS